MPHFTAFSHASELSTGIRTILRFVCGIFLRGKQKPYDRGPKSGKLNQARLLRLESLQLHWDRAAGAGREALCVCGASCDEAAGQLWGVCSGPPRAGGGRWQRVRARGAQKLAVVSDQQQLRHEERGPAVLPPSGLQLVLCIAGGEAALVTPFAQRWR